MNPIQIIFRLLILSCAVSVGACGGGSNAGFTIGTDATLSDLSVSTGPLDQIFQSSQLDYTADVSFLIASLAVTATTTDVNADIVINGQAVDNAVSSGAIELAEGVNTITVTVTAADGITTRTYTLTFTRATAASFAQQAYLKASNAEAGDQFGRSVAIAGDTLVVGAPNEAGTDNLTPSAGAAYIFIRDADVWTQQAILKASNAGDTDQFGWSVAIVDDTVVVGAYFEDSNAPNAGAAYVFTRSGTDWTQQAILKASNAGDNDQFGWSVAIVGDTVVVGAPNEAGTDNVAPNAGAAYVFTRSADVWDQQAILRASNAEGSDFFGYSVAIANNTVVVGAYGEDSRVGSSETDSLAPEAGAAYVFIRSGTDWTQQAMLKASNANVGDNFGRSVAIADDTVVVGAYLEDSSASGGETDNTAPNAGAAYVFTRSGTDWTQQAILKASNAEANDNFGYSVAIANDTVVVGADGEDSSTFGGEQDTSEPAAGAAYVFTRSGTDWTQQAMLKADNAEDSDFFGRSVAIAGDTAVVGAHNEDGADNAAPNAGATYVWQ